MGLRALRDRRVVRAKRSHHRSGRVHPARVLQWFLQVAEEERLEEYERRWLSLSRTCAECSAILTRSVDVMA
jgi:hypothetical protein